MNSSCIYDSTWISKFMVLLFCSLTGTYAGIGSSILSVLSPQIMSDLSSGDAGKLMAYLIAAFLSGWTLGGIVFGIISDRLGRVKIIFFSILLFSAATFISAFSTSTSGLAFWRFITGFGIGGAMLNVSVFLTESKLANKMIALGIFVATFQLGVFFSGILAYCCSSWQTAFMLAATWGVFSFSMLKFLRESDREVVKSEKRGSINDVKRNIFFGVAIFGCLLIGYWSSLSWIPSWMQLLPNAPINGIYFATIVHGCCAISGCLFVSICQNRFDIRLFIAGSMFGAACVSLWMFLFQTHFSSLIYMGYGVLGFCIGTAQAACYIYLPTLFPANIRATSVGICLNSGRVITLLALLSASSLMALFGGFGMTLTYFAYFYLIGACVACFAPLD